MVIKKTPVILLIASVCVYAQCNKSRLDCAETKYSFELGIKAYPDRDIIHTGDTIWLEINEPITLKDVFSGNTIDYSSAVNLGSVISFHKLSSLNQFTDKAADKFNLALLKGTQTSSIDPSFERQFLFSEENRYYVFKLAVVAKETGTFRLFFSNAANVYRVYDKCAKASFTLNFKNTNQHYYLSPTYQGGALTGGDYYFKVY